MDERFRAEVSPVERGQSARYSFRGVASTIGNVDCMRRVFLPGAFGSARRKVPLLLNHDETQVLGASTLIPKGNRLLHESSLNPKAARSAEVQSLLEEGDIMSTSISWISDDSFRGFAALKRERPELARSLAGQGLAQREDVIYFARAEIVENSVVPIPANELALIGAASLVSEDERGFIDSMREVASLALAARDAPREMAAGARNSSSDQRLIQSAHDALASLGAVCTTDDSETQSDATTDANPEGYTPEQIPLGGWSEHMHSNLDGAETAAKSRFAMPDGSYPIDTCADVSDAAKLAHHSKTYSFAAVRAHVMKAKGALKCPDSVLPATWSEASGLAAVANGSSPENVSDVQSSPPLPSELEQLDRELAELAGRFTA